MYPKPFTNSTIIEFENPEEDQYELIVYDIIGSKLKLLDGITTNMVVLEKGNLNPGVYLLELRSVTRSLYGKVVIE